MYNQNKSSGNDFQWVYFYNYGSANRTLVAIYNMDHSKPSHYNLSSFQLYGDYSLVANSLRCLMINSSSTYSLYTYDYQSGLYNLDPFDFSTLLNISIDNSYWNPG